MQNITYSVILCVHVISRIDKSIEARIQVDIFQRAARQQYQENCLMSNGFYLGIMGMIQNEKKRFHDTVSVLAASELP